MSDLDLLNEGSAAEQILQGLNDSQKEVVSAPRSNMLIVAGAGTGKTRVLVSRIAWLLLVENIPSRSIMAVTFTNKAAMEMRTRISTIVG
ncbi:MAG: UvrD-helicase domain-containing protein, partial [Succinivibrio sp.]